MAENNNSSWNWGNAVGDFFSGMFSESGTTNTQTQNDAAGNYNGHQSNFSRGVAGMASAGLKYNSSRQNQKAANKRNQATIAGNQRLQQMRIDAKKVKGVGSRNPRSRPAQVQVPSATVGSGLNKIQAEQALQQGLLGKAGV